MSRMSGRPAASSAGSRLGAPMSRSDPRTGARPQTSASWHLSTDFRANIWLIKLRASHRPTTLGVLQRASPRLPSSLRHSQCAAHAGFGGVLPTFVNFASTFVHFQPHRARIRPMSTRCRPPPTQSWPVRMPPRCESSFEAKLGMASGVQLHLAFRRSRSFWPRSIAGAARTPEKPCGCLQHC